jgi:hypothetical protein
VKTLERVTFSDEHQMSTNDFTCRTMWVMDKSEVLHRERKREQNCVRVHLWAAVGVDFKSDLVIFPRWNTAAVRKKPFRVTAVEYADRCIIPLHNAGAMKNRTFQQDNARIHTAQHTR